MNKKRLSLIGAVLLVGLGTLALVKYVSTAEDRALAGEEQVQVIVVDADVPAGTPANELQDFLRVESVPVKVRASGALASLEEADGQVVKTDLGEGEQLTASKLVAAEEFNEVNARLGRGGGSVAVPDELLEVTIPLDPIRTVGGTVRPGDLVGVIASFTDYPADGGEVAEGGSRPVEEVSGFLTHKVLVTNVQGNPVADASREATTAERAAAPTGQFFVTLAVRADVAERIVFASSYGDVWLTIEPATAEESNSIQTTEGIFG